MGSTAFRAISRPLFLIGRALDGPLLATVRPIERVRKRRLATPCARHPHRHAHSRTPRPDGRRRLCCNALRVRPLSTNTAPRPAGIACEAP